MTIFHPIFGLFFNIFQRNNFVIHEAGFSFFDRFNYLKQSNHTLILVTLTGHVAVVICTRSIKNFPYNL